MDDKLKKILKSKWNVIAVVLLVLLVWIGSLKMCSALDCGELVGTECPSWAGCHPWINSLTDGLITSPWVFAGVVLAAYLIVVSVIYFRKKA